MQIVITCTVPDEWRDETDDSGILLGPYEDLHAAVADVGAEDISIRSETLP